jgi:hypothetical protein
MQSCGDGPGQGTERCRAAAGRIPHHSHVMHKLLTAFLPPWSPILAPGRCQLVARRLSVQGGQRGVIGLQAWLISVLGFHALSVGTLRLLCSPCAQGKRLPQLSALLRWACNCLLAPLHAGHTSWLPRPTCKKTTLSGPEMAMPVSAECRVFSSHISNVELCDVRFAARNPEAR